MTSDRFPVSVRSAAKSWCDKNLFLGQKAEMGDIDTEAVRAQ